MGRNPLKRDQERKRIADNRKKVLDHFNHKCYICSIESEYTSIYDLHHVNDTEKEYSVSRIIGHSWDKIQNEINKCIMLCANCHRILHEKERRFKNEYEDN